MIKKNNKKINSGVTILQASRLILPFAAQMETYPMQIKAMQNKRDGCHVTIQVQQSYFGHRTLDQGAVTYKILYQES